MSEGIVIPILDKQRFEFSYLGVSATQTVVLQPLITVCPYFRVRLVLRVHAVNMSAAGGQSLKFALVNTLPSSEDPREFVESSDFLAASVVYGTSSPGLTSNIATDPHAYLKFYVLATQNTSAGTTLYAEVSAVLQLRGE